MNRWERAWEKPEAPSRPPAPVAVHTADGVSRYAVAALEREVQNVATATEGQRNHTLNTASFSLGQLVASGHLDETDVRVALTQAARSAGLEEREIGATIASGLRSGAKQPRDVPERTDQGLLPVTVLDVDQAADAVDLWERREILAHVRDYARARRTSPLATLGVLLARVLTATPPFAVLPPIVGSVASLNLFIALVGASGTGKGAAESVAAEAVNVGDVITLTTGSGEGIAHAYMKKTKEGVEQHTKAVLFSVPEIDTLSALGDRRGATLLPELRRAWSGERLGFAYSDPAKRLPIPAHRYRLCLVAGVQPGRAGTLLDDSDGGTPQRFLWLPATDPDAPDESPACPVPIRWQGPLWRETERSGKAVMHVCEKAKQTIDNARLARLRGDGEVLDGHSLLCRLKVAAAFAILDRRTDITDDDWDIAGIVQHISDATRTGIRAELAEAAQRRNTARGETEASRAVMVAERVEEAATQRVTRSVMRALAKCNGQGATQGELRRTLTGKDRGHLETALTALTETGLVKAEEVGGNGSQGHRYQLVSGVTS